MNNIMPILRRLFSSYPNSTASEATILSYLDRLQRVGADDLEIIVGQCLDECKFLPTIAEIFERWHLMHRGPEAQPATEAWGDVVRAFLNIGYVGNPTFDNPLTAKIVQCMGWRTLCESENQMADRAHFLRMYADLAEREEQERRLTPEFKQLRAEKQNELARVHQIVAGILSGNGNE